MMDPLDRLARICRALARPVAVPIAARCQTPRSYEQLGATLRRSPSSVKATLAELLEVGAVAKPEGAYLERALEAGELRCVIPALLRGLADEIEKAVG